MTRGNNKTRTHIGDRDGGVGVTCLDDALVSCDRPLPPHAARPRATLFLSHGALASFPAASWTGPGPI
jgi:hypothetical protein